jgi:hypothetical protein
MAAQTGKTRLSASFPVTLIDGFKSGTRNTRFLRLVEQAIPQLAA